MVASLTLTVNSRLARWLLFYHGREQAQAGLKVWETPAVYSMNDWLMQAWLQSWPEQYVLTELQSQHLWQKIIREDSDTSPLNLLHVQGAASHAFNAYQLIRKYRLPDNAAGFNHYTEETQIFRRWMTSYQKQLQEWQALDLSELLDAVSQRMEQGHIPLPGEIVFHGFDEITPQMRDWLNFLHNKQVSTHFQPFEPTPVAPGQLEKVISQKTATVQKYEDAKEEVMQCARWIRSVYKEGQTIGIVVPELETYRGILEREFKAELAPASVYPWDDQHIPFNISMGTQLSHEPMVHLALLLLSQKNKRIPLLTFSTLVTSPFLKLPEAEKPFRRELDWYLRGGNTTHVLIQKILSPEQKEKCPALVTFIKKWMVWMDKTSPRLPSKWAQIISEFLSDIKWPKDKQEWEELTKVKDKNDSLGHQYQVIKSWKECLDRLSSLDRVLQKINRHQAVLHLTHIAGETQFQLKTHEEPIQIVGLLESAGMEFDYLWIMGCHADTLPPIPNPNPFLPFLSHQQPYNLPHSTAERELFFTEQTLFRLAHACKQMVFSYPAWQGETERVPSPLLAQWLLEKNTIQISTSNKVQDHPGFMVPLERIEDYFPIPVSPEEKDFIKGGYSLLKNQAECPFRAFAIHRLGSLKKDFAELDMDDSSRGSLTHKILELFWDDVQTSARLSDLHESNNLKKQIQKNVEEGLKSFDLNTQRQNAFYELERERLISLIFEWTEFDRTRKPFKISQLEKRKTLQLQGLTLSLTVDRIDESEEGLIALIDYKTGASQTLKKWFGDRIEEPQLPLYSLIVPTDVVSFAIIRKGTSRYRGLGRMDDFISGVKSNFTKECPDLEDWGQLKEYWQDKLNRTVGEFLEGILKVDPINKKETCKHCDQKTFCRKAELFAFASGEDE